MKILKKFLEWFRCRYMESLTGEKCEHCFRIKTKEERKKILEELAKYDQELGLDDQRPMTPEETKDVNKFFWDQMDEKE